MIFHHCRRNLCSVQLSFVQFRIVLSLVLYGYGPLSHQSAVRSLVALSPYPTPLLIPTTSPPHPQRIPTVSLPHPYRIPTSFLPHPNPTHSWSRSSSRPIGKKRKKKSNQNQIVCLICCSCITSPHLRSRNPPSRSSRCVPSLRSPLVHFLVPVTNLLFCFSLGFRSLSVVHDPFHTLAS